ncbi:hypothetical protein QO019_004743, partial [Streptomyces thermodiastaticus]|nr:hypothetical protein [Streptomyces thermodiastaticus]
MDDTGSSTGLDPARVRRIGPAAYSRSRGGPAGGGPPAAPRAGERVIFNNNWGGTQGAPPQGAGEA